MSALGVYKYGGNIMLNIGSKIIIKDKPQNMYLVDMAQELVGKTGTIVATHDTRGQYSDHYMVVFDDPALMQKAYSAYYNAYGIIYNGVPIAYIRVSGAPE